MKSSERPPPEAKGILLDEFETGTFGHKFAAVFVPLLAVATLGGWIYTSIKVGFVLNSGYVVLTVMLLGLFGLGLYGSKRPVLQVPATSFPSLDVFFALVKKYRPADVASEASADVQPGG